MYGQPVSLEIVTSEANISTKLSGAPSASISAVVGTFMVEYYNANDATSDAYIQYLENQQSAYVANTIASALETAKSCKSDVFGFGKALYHKYPKESDPYKNDWCNVFRSMEVSIEVKSKIQCTYSMLNAPGE